MKPAPTTRMAPGLNAFEQYPPILELEADVCVIGSGAGGSSVAAALSESGRSVIVLEEGRSWRPRQFKPFAPWAFKNLYAGNGSRTTHGNCIIPLPGGRGVGGSTLINSAICFRTPPPVLKDWRENHGCRHFDDASMNRLFDRIWRTIGVTVQPPSVQRRNNLIFQEGVEKLGWKGGAFLERSAPGCTGCAACQQGCPTGGKLSVDRSFLAEAIGRGNVGVYADCRVDTVETDGQQIRSVSGRTIQPEQYTEGGTFRVRARQFVLCAGAIGSPRFLAANALSAGPVGEHLCIHPTAGVFARFQEPIHSWSGVTQGYYVDCWERGFLLQTFTMPPDQHYLGLPLPPEASLEFLHHLPNIASAGTVVHDEDSVGRVGSSAISYHLGDNDRARLIAGIRACAEVFFAAGAVEVVPGVHGIGALRSPADLHRLHNEISAWDLCLYASHPLGTCRMGDNPATSVVNPEGRVWEWDNLYVADASIFPTSLGVNPQVTVMAVGLTIGHQMAA